MKLNYMFLIQYFCKILKLKLFWDVIYELFIIELH